MVLTDIQQADAPPNTGDLRVWWIPQIPGKPFHVLVASPREARSLMNTLARYDQFQLDQRIKPDYCNVGGLQVYEADNGEGIPGWTEWTDEETGRQIDEVDFASEAA